MLKKILYSVTLLWGSIATAQPTMINMTIQADSCVNQTPNNGYYASCWGQFSNAVTGNTATVFWGDGTSSSATIWGQGTSGSFFDQHNYATAGIYTVKAVLYNAANSPTDSATRSMNAFCSTIYGITYKRNDANCTYDAPVDDIIKAALEIEVRKNNIPIDTFTSFGHYSYAIPNPDMVSEFSFRTLTTGTAYTLVCPTIHKVRLDTLYTSGTYGLNFAHSCNASFTGFDLFTYQNALLRFTNTSYINLYGGNVACTPTNGTLTLQISPKYTYATASTPPTSVAGNTLTWNLSNLSGTNTAHILVGLSAVGTLTPGDTATNIATITPTTGDNNTANNVYIATDSIRASYDPNDKSVTPSGNINAGQLLTYTINFENLGNDTAFNIHILDTMSGNLDIASFKLLQSSHGVGVSHIKKGIHNIVRFDYSNIKLADKNHPESNKGYVMYAIKAKNNLATGSEVRNTAHIFFDINPAVVTNTTVSKTAVTNGIEEVADSKLKLYPNPATHTLFVDNIDATYSKVTITNAVGQRVGAQHLISGSNSINITSLSKGVYYLTASGNKNTVVLKFLVK